MGTACACEVYETSSSLPFAIFSKKYAIFTSWLNKFQLPGVWECRFGAGKVETTLKNALIQAPNVNAISFICFPTCLASVAPGLKLQT